MTSVLERKKSRLWTTDVLIKDSHTKTTITLPWMLDVLARKQQNASGGWQKIRREIVRPRLTAIFARKKQNAWQFAILADSFSRSRYFFPGVIHVGSWLLTIGNVLRMGPCQLRARQATAVQGPQAWPWQNWPVSTRRILLLLISPYKINKISNIHVVRTKKIIKDLLTYETPYSLNLQEMYDSR